MKKRIFFAVLLAMLWGAPRAPAAMTNSASNIVSPDYVSFIGSMSTTLDPVYLFGNEVEGLLEGTSAFGNLLDTDSYIQFAEMSAPGSPAANHGRLYVADDSGTTTLYFKDSSGTVSSCISGSGTFTGGAISSDVTLANGVDIYSSTTAAHTSSIGVRRDSAYVDAFRWTNHDTTPALVLGSATTSLAVTSTGLNVTTAGAVTGVTDLTATGTQTINASGSDATNIGTGSYSGTVTLGNNSASVAVGSSAWDISSDGAMSGFSSLGLSGDITMAHGKGVKSSTTTAQSVGVYGYDVGAGYVGALVVTNSATPATVLGNTSGTTAISSSDWTVSTAGNAAGLGTITSDGLFTCTGGETMTGTVSINDSATTSTTSIGGGTTTGTITIGGTGTQAVDIGNGAGIKTVALGSSTTSSTTTIKGGSNGVNVNVSADDPTNINTGTSTGTVTIGGTGALAIAIGDGGTGAKTITLGDGAGAGSTTIKAGTGNLDLSAVDDVSLNGGSAGSIIAIGTNTHGNVLNIATDDTALDDINIGSAKDTPTILGSAIVITAGTDNLAMSATDDVSLNGGSAGSILNLMTNTHGNVLNIATDDTALDDINIGSAKDTPTILGATIVVTAGDGDLTMSSNDDVTLNGGSAGSIINIGTNTHGNAINVGTNNTTADTIAVGSAKDTVTVDGISTTIGSTGTTSATIIQSGTSDLDINAGAALDIDAATTLDILAGGAFSIDGSNAASNISLATNGDSDDFTIGLTGATNSSILLNSTGTGTDAIGLTAGAGGITASAATGAVALSGLTGNTITATAVADGAKGTTLSGSIAGATASEGVGAYVEGNITGNTDGKVYAFGSWLNVTAGTPTDGSDAILAGADVGIYAAAAPELVNCKLRVLNLEYQVHADAGPIDDTTSMIHFNADSGGDVPDYLFTFGNADAAVYTANTTHTAANTDKIGAIKISITGTAENAYLYVYSHAGQ